MTTPGPSANPTGTGRPGHPSCVARFQSITHSSTLSAFRLAETEAVLAEAGEAWAALIPVDHEFPPIAVGTRSELNLVLQLASIGDAGFVLVADLDTVPAR